MDIAYKSFDSPQLAIKGKSDGGTEHGELHGYASTWANWDDIRPIPERAGKGAFLESISQMMRHGFIARQHDWKAVPIATLKDLKEDDTGLFYVAEFHSTPEAQSERMVAQERIARGKSVRTSIGYELPTENKLVRIEDAGLKAQGFSTGRLLTKIPLVEISLANVPVNRMAEATGVKSLLRDGLTMDDHQDEALAAVSGFIDRVKGLQEMRGKAGRKISAERRQRLLTLMQSLHDSHADLEALLRDTDPEADAETVMKAIAECAVMSARHKGVLRNGQTART